LRSRKYLAFQESTFSKLLNSLGLNWDRLSEPGFFSKLYKISLKFFPKLLEFTKNQVSSDFIVSDEVKLKSNVSAFGINEPVAWIRLSKDSDLNTIYLQLTESKKQELLKNVFKTAEIFHGKYVDKAIGQLLVEAKEGWAIDTTRLNGGKLVGKPLFTKKGVHQQAGIFSYLGALTPKSDAVYRIQDIVPTVLGLMALPIPKNIDGSPIIIENEILTSAWKLDIAQSL